MRSFDSFDSTHACMQRERPRAPGAGGTLPCSARGNATRRKRLSDIDRDSAFTAQRVRQFLGRRDDPRSEWPLRWLSSSPVVPAVQLWPRCSCLPSLVHVPPPLNFLPGSRPTSVFFVRVVRSTDLRMVLVERRSSIYPLERLPAIDCSLLKVVCAGWSRYSDPPRRRRCDHQSLGCHCSQPFHAT